MNFTNLSLSDLKVLSDLSKIELKKWEENVLFFTETQKQNEDYKVALEKTEEFHVLLSHIEEELYNRTYMYFKD